MDDVTAAWAALRKDFEAFAEIGAATSTFLVGVKNAKWMKDRARFAQTALKRMDELEHGTTLEADGALGGLVAAMRKVASDG